MPCARAPARAAVIAATPVPIPTSSTASPGAMPANRTSCALTGVVKVAVGANDAHIARCRSLNAESGSEVTLSLRVGNRRAVGLLHPGQNLSTPMPTGTRRQFLSTLGGAGAALVTAGPLERALAAAQRTTLIVTNLGGRSTRAYG